MALRAGYYGVKRFLRNKLETIARTYDETIKSLFPRSEQAVLGAKNLLPNNAISGSDNNATWTVNADGTITVTTGEDSTSGEVNIAIGNCNVKQGVSYTISDDSPNPSGSTYRLWTNSTTAFGTNNRLSTGTEASRTRTANADETVSVVLQIFSGQKVNLTFKPMIRLATDPDDTYVPYAMTNKELTDSAAEQKTAINAIITAATGAADFAAFKTAMGAITPVTRSLSLIKEDITEEVKEAVEPEKTVTKKRTTKKTEEV